MFIFSGFKPHAILTAVNFANINSNEYFCPVGYPAHQLGMDVVVSKSLVVSIINIRVVIRVIIWTIKLFMENYKGRLSCSHQSK